MHKVGREIGVKCQLKNYQYLHIARSDRYERDGLRKTEKRVVSEHGDTKRGQRRPAQKDLRKTKHLTGNREGVNLRRKIASVVKCCWQAKQNRHEHTFTGCNYMGSSVGSFGNMANTNWNEVVGDEGRRGVMRWAIRDACRLALWGESSGTGGTRWSTAECPEEVRGDRLSILQVVRAQERDLP